MKIKRNVVENILDLIKKAPFLLQIIIGPRQVGKTTAVAQVVESLGWPTVVATADAPRPPDAAWIEEKWNHAKEEEKKSRGPILLVLDEIQKVEGWSEVVKRLWDEEKASGGKLRVILLGSSSLLMQKGMTESLAGRFYLHRCMHWTFEECHHAFGWDLNKWFFFGGYPGPATLIHDEKIWKNYINDSLIETVLARDVMQLQTVSKPILLRNLFGFATAFPAQIFSYNKMLGQLTDAGNTTTLATYLKLLETAFLVSGLEKFSRGKVRQRGSSPKLILWNNALVNAFDQHSYEQMQQDPIWRGRLIENAVGASFLNSLTTSNQSLTYWRDGNDEVDFVLTIGQQIWAIEVKSGLPRKISGLTAFKKAYPKAKSFLIGSHGVPLEEFFLKPALSWFL